MNRTNRVMNRALLAISGLVLLAAGALAAGAGLLPGIRDRWGATGAGLLATWHALLPTAPAPEPLGSWWALAVPALALIGAAASIFWLTRQGGGRTRTAALAQDAELGDTSVDISYLAAAVEDALDGNRAVVGTSLTAWRARTNRDGGTALRLTLQARKGASPRQVADLAEDLVEAMDGLLGHQPTVLVRIGSGTRTRLAGAHRAG